MKVPLELRLKGGEGAVGVTCEDGGAQRCKEPGSKSACCRHATRRQPRGAEHGDHGPQVRSHRAVRTVVGLVPCPKPFLPLYSPWAVESSGYSVVHQIHWFYFTPSPSSLLSPLLSALVRVLTVTPPLICEPGHLSPPARSSLGAPCVRQLPTAQLLLHAPAQKRGAKVAAVFQRA